MGCTRSVLLFQNRLMLQVRLITSIPRHRHRNTFSEEKGQLSHILTPVMNKTFGYYWYKMSPQMPRQQNHNHIHQKTQFWYYCKYLCYRLCYRLCLCKMNLWLFCWKKMIKKRKENVCRWFQVGFHHTGISSPFIQPSESDVDCREHKLPMVGYQK